MGAFDNAEDFARVDVIAMAGRSWRPMGTAKVWIDLGTSDPFYLSGADSLLVSTLRSHGQKVIYHTSPGGHAGAYSNRHVGQYMKFYANALADC